MTFVRKFSGDRTAPIIAVYTCPEHGEMDVEVTRNELGEAPDEIECPCGVIAPGGDGHGHIQCCLPTTWTPSATVGCRVRRVEAVRGKWEPPERKSYLDTRKLGEGQDPEEFRKERKAMWTEQRRQRVKELLR